MKRGIQVAVMATLAIALVVAPVAAEVTDREVRQAIERGVEYLKTQQDKSPRRLAGTSHATGRALGALHPRAAQLRRRRRRSRHGQGTRLHP